MEAELLASRPKKSKGKGRVQLFTSAIVATPIGDDLSYLSPMNTILGETLRDVPLATDIGGPLKLKESLRH